MHESREAAGYEYLDTDIKFTKEQLLKFPVTAINAGLAAGLLGIGGGMVIGPLFIEIGMQPQVCLYLDWLFMFSYPVRSCSRSVPLPAHI